MNDVRETLRRAVKNENYSLRDLSIRLSKNEAYLQQFLERNIPKKLKPRDAIYLARLLELDESALLHPEDQQLLNTLSKKNIYMGDFADKSEIVKQIAIETLEHLPDTYENIVFAPAPDDTTSCAIKEIDARAAAGDGSLNGDEAVLGTWRFPWTYIEDVIQAEPHGLRIITIVGDSMAPTLMSGDKVIVDTAQQRPSPPGVFVIWDGMAVVAKRIEHIPGTEPTEVQVLSDNPAYTDYTRSLSKAHILGRIVWLSRSI
jgi:phage repressor protein C with HTH and peptisase S24 domain